MLQYKSDFDRAIKELKSQADDNSNNTPDYILGKLKNCNTFVLLNAVQIRGSCLVSYLF